MKALVLRGPNEFAIEEVPVPEPGRSEVLCKVRAVTICGTDSHLIRGDYPGFWPPAHPFTPGHEWAGEIVALGEGAADLGWRVGERIAGTSHDACGFCQMCVEGRYNLCDNYGSMDLHRHH
ncbi:MAG: alcohol dehydrogenase catalytic domain-containing protein, partial [Actinobacteria bacterium]|nr:alcohol dehydrogenase catalytic domain-containing protein [Actinomycetota bacterium]